MRTSLRIALPSLALAAFLIAPSAAAANPSCGQTLTSSVKLTANLDCSASNSDGLNAGAGGITINLNGHTLIGPGGGAGPFVGIDNSTGYDHVTVEGGVIKNYHYGVYAEYASNMSIHGLGIQVDGTDSNYGIGLYYSGHSLIRGVSISGQPYEGIGMEYNTGVDISKTHIGGGEYEIYDEYSKATISRTSANNGEYGIYTEYPTIGYKITKSTANGNSEVGIYVEENYPSFLYQATLTDNVANGNGDYGLYADLDVPGSGNRAHGNTPADCFHVVCNAKHHHKRRHHRHHHKHHH